MFRGEDLPIGGLGSTSSDGKHKAYLDWLYQDYDGRITDFVTELGYRPLRLSGDKPTRKLDLPESIMLRRLSLGAPK